MPTTPRHLHARAFWALQVGGWTAYAVALMVPWLGRYPISVMWSNKLVIAATGLATSSSLRLVYRRIAREGASLPTLCVTAVAASVAGAFVWNSVASAILGRSLQNDSVLLGALGRTLPRFDGVLYHSLVLLTWSLLYLGARHYRALVAERERSLQAESLAREARLLALRYQIGPHFLFNALNAISTLVVTDRKADATATIARLADLLRVSLDAQEHGTVTLASELEIVRAYVAIERVRFGDRLQVVIDADEATLDARVPAMLLQPVVENAVRHAVAVHDEPTCIRVSSRAKRGIAIIPVEGSVIPSGARDRDPPRREPSLGTMKILRFARDDNLARDDLVAPAHLVLTISDNGPGVGDARGFGVGLANVRARLDELYPGNYTFVAGPTPDGGYRAEISLPLSPEPALVLVPNVIEAQLA
jgi:signal transduction histidine kinase